MAQTWDYPAQLSDWIATETDGKWKLGFESRGRYESRFGQTFGRDVDLETGLVRHRLSLTFNPYKWLKISAMAQDSRAPWFGRSAPNNLRDQLDLQESYLEIAPPSKTGFGLSIGRQMINYGDARLIGSPQWGNLARTFDRARLFYTSTKMQLEFLVASPVKIRLGEFNMPVLGDRIWGVYNTFPNLFRKATVDIYILKHDQNRQGGFAGGTRALGTDKLGTRTYGGRIAGPLGTGWKYAVEGALQEGMVGAAEHRAGAWSSNVTRRLMAREKPLDLGVEYKFASGSKDLRDTTKSGTFDQLYPANHDKLGHEDLFGWRNLHDLRFLGSYGVTKTFSLNLMYNHLWLASARDGIYSNPGRLLFRSVNGTAGRHVGQETDLFFTYKYQHLLMGAGYGHFVAGSFIRQTTPGVNPVFLYMFHTYSF